MTGVEERREERFRKRREERQKRLEEHIKSGEFDFGKTIAKIQQNSDNSLYEFSEEDISYLNKITFDICKEKHFI